MDAIEEGREGGRGEERGEKGSVWGNGNEWDREKRGRRRGKWSGKRESKWSEYTIVGKYGHAVHIVSEYTKRQCALVMCF